MSKIIKFVTPVSMEVTKEQYRKDLKKPLKDLGYNIGVEGNGGLLFTNGNSEPSYGYLNSRLELKSKNNRHFINHYNPELFLALAAMTKRDMPVVEEYVIAKKGGYPVRKVTKVMTDGDIYHSSSDASYSKDYYRKATKEELIKHFSKATNSEVETPKTNDELLAYAKEHYPIGTVHEGFSSGTGNTFTTTEEAHWTYNNIYGGAEGCIYSSAKKHWAKIISKPKATTKEWSKGTYAVALKGNFGIFDGSRNKLTVGNIFTIKKDYSARDVSVKESDYWIYKKNLKWFATKQEAGAYSRELLGKATTKEEVTEHSEYYKWNEEYTDNSKKFIGKIVKYNPVKMNFSYNDKYAFECGQSAESILKWGTPSTKEEYDAQFNDTPKQTEFKAGDWVIGWHCNYKERRTKAWEIASISPDGLHARPVGGGSTGIVDIRLATAGEIMLAKGIFTELVTPSEAYQRWGSEVVEQNKTALQQLTKRKAKKKVSLVTKRIAKQQLN